MRGWLCLLWFLQPSTATGRTRPILHRARSAYTIKPKSASTKAAAARRPSTANNDSATNSRKTYFDPGGYWEREDMGSIKDRLSIQTFLPQALRVQSPPSTPTSSTHAGSSTASSRRESVSRTSVANASSPSGSGSVLRRGFGRARAQTHTGAAITSVLASSSLSTMNENEIREVGLEMPVYIESCKSEAAKVGYAPV